MKDLPRFFEMSNRERWLEEGEVGQIGVRLDAKLELCLRNATEMGQAQNSLGALVTRG